MRQPDPFEGAKCREPEHEEWARKHRGSRWDYKIDNESDQEAAARRRYAQGLCFACPVRQECRDEHTRLAARKKGEQVPGVWGGVIHREYASSTHHRRMATPGLFPPEDAFALLKAATNGDVAAYHALITHADLPKTIECLVGAALYFAGTAGIDIRAYADSVAAHLQLEEQEEGKTA